MCTHGYSTIFIAYENLFDISAWFLLSPRSSVVECSSLILLSYSVFFFFIIIITLYLTFEDDLKNLGQTARKTAN